jgi:Helicase HerA, central domain
MSDLWGEADAASLLGACRAHRFGAALDQLRHGPFLRSNRCAPPPALDGTAWFELRQMPPAEPDRASPLLGLFQTMVADTRGLALHLGSDAGRPRVLLGTEGGALREAHVRSLLAPAVLIDRSPEPGPWGSGPKAGLVYRLAPTGLELEARQPAQTTISRLLTLPVAGWAVLWVLRPVPTHILDGLLAAVEDCEVAVAPHIERTQQRTATASATVTDPLARRLASWLDLLHSHVAVGRSVGMWLVSCHASAPPEVMGMLVSGLRGSLADRPDGGGAWVASSYDAQHAGAPPPHSLLSSRDLERLFEAPPASVPGLSIAPALPAGRVQVPAARPMRLGRRLGTEEAFTLDLHDLEGHGFVTGTTGCGKSTTVRRLLLDLWNDHGVPFLVVDPVKSDYEELAADLHGGLTVLDARRLRINVLRAWRGADPHVHLEQVANIFKGSFSMPSPVPYVVTHLFDLLAERVGVEPEPTLHDLHERVDALVRDLGYIGEAEGVIRAALGNRIGLLVSPVRGDRLASSDIDQLEAVLERPTVIELAGIGEDEERAFLMSVLTLYVAEAARTRGATSGVLHVMVLEEAHRILPEPGAAGSDPERGDPGGTSARLLTQLLAEVRGYGESLVIVDQSPGAVARDVLRNTNLKVSHRLLASEDRESVAASMGLPEDGSWSLARLEPGQALVSSRRVPEPQAVLVEPQGAGARGGALLTPPLAPSARPCCAGHEDIAAHHHAERHGAEAAWIMAVYATGALTGRPADDIASWAAAELGRLVSRRPGTRAACLAWVGLRRVLEHDLAVGALPPGELASRLAAIFSAWQGRLAVEPRPTGSPANVPFVGCAWCTCRCTLRGAALARLAGEPRAGLRELTAPRARDPVGGCRTWMADQEALLAPLLGAGTARSLALCTLLHGLDAARIDERVIREILRIPGPR